MGLFPVRSTIWLLVAMLTAATASAQERLTPHTAEYKVKISILSGKLKTRLQLTDSG